LERARNSNIDAPSTRSRTRKHRADIPGLQTPYHLNGVTSILSHQRGAHCNDPRVIRVRTVLAVRCVLVYTIDLCFHDV
jgi:hypothetical protein